MRTDSVTETSLRLLSPAIWCLLMAALLVMLSVKYQLGFNIETNILALLPATEQDHVVEQASRQFNQNLSRRHIILIGSEQFSQAEQAASEVVTALIKMQGISRIEFRFDEDKQQQVIASYLSYKNQLLTTDVRSQLQQGGKHFLQSTLQLVYSPLLPLSSALLESDPLLLFYRFAAGLSRGHEAIELKNGLLVAQYQKKHYVLINLLLADTPFSIQLQKELMTPLDNELASLASKNPQLEILNVGVMRYAQTAVQSAHREVTTIGLGSLAAIVFVLLWVFRSPVPLFASLLAIAAGFIAAFTACQWVFGSVHLLTLVFGASLIGISIDYSFHFFTERLGSGSAWTGPQGIRRIYSGISLGLVTSVLAYAGMCFAPFPGMQQIALFSCVGLFVAFFTVVALFPRYISAPREAGRSLQWLKLANNYAAYLEVRSGFLVVLLIVLGVIGLAGVQRLSVDDDVRLLQSASPQLRDEESRAMDIVGRGLSNQFLLVEGGTVEQVLQREEHLQERLKAMQLRGELKKFDAITQKLPSKQRQQEDWLLVREQLLSDDSLLEGYADTLGLDPVAMERFSSSFKDSEKDYLTLQQWLSSAAGLPWNYLWIGQTDRGYASVVSLYGGKVAALVELEKNTQGVTLVDKVTDISNLLSQYRQQAGALVLLSYLLIYFLLCYRYGLLRAFRVICPPAMAVLLTLGGLGWLGYSINIFHLLALLLILGVGIDYTLFLEEGKHAGSGHRGSTLLAILLSAFTTLVSFGLLSLSSTPAVHAFGMTVLIGITVCTVLAPMLCGRNNFN